MHFFLNKNQNVFLYLYHTTISATLSSNNLHLFHEDLRWLLRTVDEISVTKK